MAEQEQTLEIEGHTINVSRLDKRLFPDGGYTKGDIIDYYRCIAGTMVPHLRERPLTMQRFPDGIGKEGFYEKEAPDYFPDWIERVSIEVEEEGQTQPQVVCNDAATLVYLANQACITPHTWLSRMDELRHPDKLIFDLDPPDDDFEVVRFVAQTLHDLLDGLGLVAFVMTTGSRGLHVAVPLDRSASFEQVRSFAEGVADLLAQRHPDRLTSAERKDKRQGRLFIDYLRNSYAQHGVAPYALRPKPGAPIATPIEWDRLFDSNLDSQSYTIENIFRRLGQTEDPWRGMFDQAHAIGEAQAQLDAMR